VFIEWAMLPPNHASYADETRQWELLEQFQRGTRCDPFALFRSAEAFGVPPELVAVPADVLGFVTLPDDGPGGPAEPWPAPQPLIATVDPQPYPLDALPPRIRAAVAEVQAFVQAPVPLVAASALSALAVSAQGLADVQRAEKLQGPCSLFFLSIADSGERKSTLDGFFMAPVHEYERAMAAFIEPERESCQSKLKVWEHRRQGLLDAIRGKTRKGQSTVEEEQRLHATDAQKPKPPIAPRLLLADETPESLAYKLAKEWPSAAVASAEAGVVFGGHAMGKDSAMRNLALLNTLWDGGRHSVGRRTSESFTVDGVRFSMGLQVQEATLRAYLEQTGELARGSGFLARFLIAWPRSTQGHRPFKAAPESWPALAAFRCRLAELLNEPLALDAAGRLTPPLLTLTPAAHAAWVEFHDGVEAELRAGGAFEQIKDVASKAADNVARLATLFHLFEGAGGPVSEDAIVRAACIVGFHVHEARRFFGELALPADLAAAQRLDAWLLGECRRTGVQRVTRREAQKRGPVRDGRRLDAALRELEELDRVRVRTEGRAKFVEINPALLREGGVG
jgi:putative DNA primase/helicase